jgi:hypothetical protein
VNVSPLGIEKGLSPVPVLVMGSAVAPPRLPVNVWIFLLAGFEDGDLGGSNAYLKILSRCCCS